MVFTLTDFYVFYFKMRRSISAEPNEFLRNNFRTLFFFNILKFIIILEKILQYNDRVCKKERTKMSIVSKPSLSLH